MLLLVTSPLPAIIPAWYLLWRCQSAQHYQWLDAHLAGDNKWLCTLIVQRPVSAVAILYFGTGVVLFWALSLAQQSTCICALRRCFTFSS